MKRKKKINVPVLIGSIIIGCFVLVAVFAPWIAPYDPTLTSVTTYAKPSAEHWLGTNDVGQDIFSELIYGTRISMLIGVFVGTASSIYVSSAVLLALGDTEFYVHQQERPVYEKPGEHGIV